MPVDNAMVGRNRGRDETSEASDGHAGSSKRGRGGAGSKLVFECTTCGKAFWQSSNLTRHERTHSGDRPYPCTTCGMAFSRSTNLTAHERTHTGHRPYACTTCGQAFSLNGDLTKHMRTHSGDRPYPCTTCGKAFSQNSDLKRHRKNVHSLNRAWGHRVVDSLVVVVSTRPLNQTCPEAGAPHVLYVLQVLRAPNIGGHRKLC